MSTTAHAEGVQPVFLFDLLDELWVGGLIQAIYFLGFLFGVVLLGQTSDKYGRRRTMIAGFSLLFPVCIISSFATSWQMFAAFRFATGLLLGGVCLVMFVYMQEICERSYWALTGAVQSIFFPLGIVIFVGVAYLVPSWRQMVRLLSCLQLLPMAGLMFLPESPRWLYANGNLQKAESVLVQFAKRNGVKNPDSSKVSFKNNNDQKLRNISVEVRICGPPFLVVIHLILTIFVSLKPLDVEKPKKNVSILDLCRHRVTLKRLIVMGYLWFINSFVYYALTLAAGEIGNSTYTSEALSGLVEIPGILALPFLLNRKWCGRKRAVLISFLISGFSCLSLMGFDPHSTSNWKMVLGLLGKLAISFSFNSVYVFAPELFPTSVRNVAMGSVSMIARVGGILASFSESLLETHALAGYFMFGVGGISAGLLTLFLPETLGSKPPNSFEDLDQPTLRSNYSGLDDSVALTFPSFRKRSSTEEKAELLADEEDDEV